MGVAVGAYNADKAGAADSGMTRVYDFTVSDWILSVERFEASFTTGTQPELTLTYQGTAPDTAKAARSYRMSVTLPPCDLDLGLPTSTAIAPVKATGTVPSTSAYQLTTQLDVNTETIRSSGFYSSGTGV